MRITPFIGLLILCAGCFTKEHRFHLVADRHSGIRFSNTLKESDSLNALTFEYIYNGGGVATADFNNDGLTDIFFAGNQTSCGLYLNKGDLTFEDVTSPSGVTTDLWCTGVAIVDINGDGLMDIYVSTITPDNSSRAPNLFFINQGVDERGIPSFTNMAPQLGVADSSYSSQAAFFDYDLDGDMDMYLLTNSLERYTRNAPIGQRYDGTGASVDKLFRNDTLANGQRHFTDVSRSAGILGEGWGLGIVVNDFNADGWPDVYCANDFLSSDHLYINQHDGTFTDRIGDFMNHEEFNGMGADMADLNNDALNDLVVVDMMPDDNVRQKTMFTGKGYDRFMKSLAMGYQPQYVRNVLQRNNGNNTFSDLGYMSGIYATDWSWAPLLADFDNDGNRDIFITNGYPKDITDLDFVTYSKEVSRFGTDSLKKKNAANAIQTLGGVLKPNFMFHNKGDLAFDDVTAEWGFSEPSYSNGAAYADFDNDGDLDLITNNLNGRAQLYENTTDPMKTDGAHFVRLQLRGDRTNPQGIGAKVWLYCGTQVHYAEQQLQRGYFSSVDPVMHFGLGSINVVDSIHVVWPGNHLQRLYKVSADSVIPVFRRDAISTYLPEEREVALLVEDPVAPSLIQREREYPDYKYGQPTLPHKFSQQGPDITVADINGDGLDDFVVGGPAHERAKIFFQQSYGGFRSDSLPQKAQEDTGVLLFDADGDHDPDLYCVSGSSEFGRDSAMYQDRFYTNNGSGRFVLQNDALPHIAASGSCVIAADYDGDHDLDLFVGGRVVPMAYPSAPRSYLLRNDGKGKFADATTTASDSLARVGMVTSALFTDFDGDGWKDLIVVGEWMPITIFRNDHGFLRKVKELDSGLWNSISGGDFDNDGDTDYIVGNLGKNSFLQARPGQPLSLYAKDFDGNGSLDPIISRFNQGKEYPIHYRETMTDQISMLRKVLTSYAAYGSMQMSDVLDFLGTEGMITRRALRLESCYLENLGAGNFSLRALPSAAQVSPIYGILACKLNDDEHLDFLAVGNSFCEETVGGYYDAGTGICALGRGDGSFEILTPDKSGFCVRTDAKGLAEIKGAGKKKWIVTSNMAPLKMFEGAASSGQLRTTLVSDSSQGR